jgi:hypothetical protein
LTFITIQCSPSTDILFFCVNSILVTAFVGTAIAFGCFSCAAMTLGAGGAETEPPARRRRCRWYRREGDVVGKLSRSGRLSACRREAWRCWALPAAVLLGGCWATRRQRATGWGQTWCCCLGHWPASLGGAAGRRTAGGWFLSCWLMVDG